MASSTKATPSAERSGGSGELDEPRPGETDHGGRLRDGDPLRATHYGRSQVGPANRRRPPRATRCPLDHFLGRGEPDDVQERGRPVMLKGSLQGLAVAGGRPGRERLLLAGSSEASPYQPSNHEPGTATEVIRAGAARRNVPPTSRHEACLRPALARPPEGLRGGTRHRCSAPSASSAWSAPAGGGRPRLRQTVIGGGGVTARDDPRRGGRSSGRRGFSAGGREAGEDVVDGVSGLVVAVGP